MLTATEQLFEERIQDAVNALHTYGPMDCEALASQLELSHTITWLVLQELRRREMVVVHLAPPERRNGRRRHLYEVIDR